MQRRRLESFQGIWRAGEEQSIPVWAVWVPMLFIVVSLLALLITPIVIDARLDTVRARLIQTAQSARDQMDDLSVSFAREVSSIRGFVLRPDESFRESFYQSRAESGRAYELLEVEASRLGPRIQERVVALQEAQSRWFTMTEGVLTGQMSQQEYLDRLDENQRAFIAAIAAARDLDRALDDEMFAQQRAERRIERVGIYFTGVLALLTFLSAFFVFWLGTRFRKLAQAMDRRAQSEQAMRQVAHVLVGEHEESEILGYLATHAAGVVDADGALVEQVQPSAPEARIFTGSGAGSNPHPRVVDYDASIASRVYAKGWAGSEPWTAIRLECPMPEGIVDPEPGLCYVLAATIHVENQPVGLLVFVRRKTVNKPFDEEEAARARVLADMASLSLRRLRLLKSEQQARRELEQAVQTRDDVLAVVSHDLRSPLATISLGAAILGESAKTDDQFRYVEIIKRMTRRMSRLIQDLLDTARTQAGHALVVLPHKTHVAEMVNEACEGVRVQADDQMQTFTVTVPESLPDVWADKDRVLQVLTNLLTNAVKFTLPGGTISLTAQAEGEEVVFAITDTGSGISPEDQERIFDPFWQVLTTSKLGAGLGLPICKSIIEAHEGRIWVESEVGKGATFYFTLPAVEEGTDFQIPVQFRGEAE